MQPHHQETIDRLSAHFKDDPAFDALIIGGSLAKGWDRPDSDVDFMLLATDDEYARRVPDNQLTFFSTEFTDYAGGYVDGKIVNRAFLHEVAACGSEPARSAFVGVWIVYSRWPELADLLAQITTYPEANHVDKLQSFYAHFEAAHWFIGEAEKRQQAYLLMRFTTEMVLFATRMILAHNRIIYPYHKWMLTAVEAAPDKPADFLPLVNALLAEPNKVRAAQLFDCMKDFADWPKPPEGWGARFLRDSEWNWRNGQIPPVADW